MSRIWVMGTVLPFLSCAHPPGPNWPDAHPPRAGKVPAEFVAHGDARVDDYAWLNRRDDPKVLAHLRAENEYFDRMTAPLRPLQEKLFGELKGRIKERDASVPFRDNGYWYSSRFQEGWPYPVYVRQKGTLDAPEEVLLDVNRMAEGHAYINVAGRYVSDDNSVLATFVDTVSRRLYDLKFKDLRTGEPYPETLRNTQGGDFAWASDSRTCFYVRRDTTTLLGYQVWRHVLGTDPAADELVYEEKDNRFNLDLYRSRSKRFVVLVSDMNKISTEVRLLEASNPRGSFAVFHPRERGLQYYVEDSGDRFYVRTDWNAPNFRLMETPAGNTSKEHWRERVAHRDDVHLGGLTVFRDHLVLSERKEGLNRLRILRLSDGQDHGISFEEPVYSAAVDVNPDPQTKVLRFSYVSMTTPPSIYDYDMDLRRRELKKREDVLGGFRSEDYASERLWATARDGVRVPISLVYRKGFRKDGRGPLLLYGYGSYGASMSPSFSPNVLSLLDRGFVYAVAHVRGGMEMGRRWYDDGRMLRKKNTFTDFIDCAEHLVREGVASRDRLYAMGVSAGGLLMGAVVNLRPDLWRGVVAKVPFVDVVTTMSDASIPLTTGEYEEWGNPARPEEYAYMKSYSPVDNVGRQAYPHLFVTTGLHDSQVQYFEPAKWVAKLRELKTDANALLFKVQMGAGHSGPSGRFEPLREVAWEYAFLLALEGIQQ